MSSCHIAKNNVEMTVPGYACVREINRDMGLCQAIFHMQQMI